MANKSTSISENRHSTHSAKIGVLSVIAPVINSYVRFARDPRQSTAAATIQFARFITSLQLDQEPEETELAPCFLAYPT